MSDFARIRERANIQDVAQRYGLVLNRWGKAVCPFHEDRRPSLSFKNNRFKCFACGKSGSVLDLAAKLNGDLSIIAAAKLLNQDFGLGLFNSDSPIPVNWEKVRKEQENARQIQGFEDWINTMALCYSVYVRTIRNGLDLFKPTDPDAPFSDAYVDVLNRLPCAEADFQRVFIEKSFPDQISFFESFWRDAQR